MSAIRRLSGFLEGAKGSKLGLLKLNFILLRVIPFNKPHGFKITHIDENQSVVHIPYKTRNLNHLKGIHACAIATASEYSSGILLLSRLSAAKYRIIMKSIHVEYHYQAKMPVNAVFAIKEQELKSDVFIPLEQSDSVMKHFKVEVHDTDGNHIATSTMEWQLKNWKKVKTA
jgi:acyl-coenzyme A thioesterase PaaI-like protein